MPQKEGSIENTSSGEVNKSRQHRVTMKGDRDSNTSNR